MSFITWLDLDVLFQYVNMYKRSINVTPYTNCSLIYDETSNSPAPATARYGLCLVLAGLLPTLAAVLHLHQPRGQVSCHWSRRSNTLLRLVQFPE